MILVGLTGGIGSGKSTVINYFKEFFITVVINTQHNPKSIS